MEKDNTEIKQCSKCRKHLTLDNFKPDRKLCVECLEYKAKYRERHREEINQKAKERYEENREELKQKRSDYVKVNRDKVLQQKKEYRERNVEQIKEQKKKHSEKYKEDILTKNSEYQKQVIECPICKCQIGKYRIARHEETNKHKNNMMKQSE